MSSKRIVASCAFMALVVVAGSWYAVGAFPLAARDGTLAADVQGGPGSLERRANPVTPENPIPRRIGYVEPQFPAGPPPSGSGGQFQILLTLDAAGRVAEARAVGLSVWSGTARRVVRWDPSAPGDWQPWMRGATDAVRQWRYDPPFDPPLTFAVTVAFGEVPPPPPPPPPPAPQAAGTSRKTPGMPPPPPPPPPKPTRGVQGGVAGGVPGGVVGGVVGGVGEAERVDASGALRVGGNIAPPTKVKDVRPIYPDVARAARVQGTVIVEVRIEADGTVSDLRILRSIPLLDQAAIDAVRQWEFTPTLLNGRPIPIVMTTTVSFTLQ